MDGMGGGQMDIETDREGCTAGPHLCVGIELAQCFISQDLVDAQLGHTVQP